MARLLLIPLLALAGYTEFLIIREMWQILLATGTFGPGESLAAGIVFAIDAAIVILIPVFSLRAIDWFLKH